MIDNFSILLSHGFLMLAFWFLLQRTDLNSEPPPVPDPEPQGFGKRQSTAPGAKPKPGQNPYRKQNQKPINKMNAQDTPDA
jgi:hypothetical protein